MRERSQMGRALPSPAIRACVQELAAKGVLSSASVARLLGGEALRPMAAGSGAAPVDPVAAPTGLRHVSVHALPHLAAVNQLYGVEAGDRSIELLRAILTASLLERDPEARLLRAEGSQVVVRHGPRTSSEVESDLQHIRLGLEAAVLRIGAAGLRIHAVLASVALAARAGPSDDELLHLLQQARRRAERAESGTCLLGPDETEAALAELRERALQIDRVGAALRARQVEVFYQPVVRLSDGRLYEVEALARIRDGARVLAAAEFIDVVHDLGEIAELDAQVFERIREQAHELSRASGRLFVNVSPRSLASPAFRAVMDDTVRRLREEGLSLVLVLELTEQALLEHLEVVREIHRNHGVSFAVDDFGTGYSSLKTVSDLAVSRVLSVLKIDGSLTRQLSQSSEAYKVVLAIAQLARSLDLQVIAEHVETAEALERLRSIGIECGQGFLFDTPLPLPELLARYADAPEARQLPAPPSHLRLLEPYLSKAFQAFYAKLLSDRHFASFFRGDAQVRRLIDRQQQTFLDSLEDSAEALRERYLALGRLHWDLGLPFATFMRGVDLLHRELLDVLAHVARDASLVPETLEFFEKLRHHMAQGYLERQLPRARAQLQPLRTVAVAQLMSCADALLALAEGSAGTAAAAETCPATGLLAGCEQPDLVSLHQQLHAEQESLAFFLERGEAASAFPALEALLGRMHLLLLRSGSGR